MKLGAVWGEPADPTYIVKSIFIDLTKDSDDVPSAERQLGLRGRSRERQLLGKDQPLLIGKPFRFLPTLHVKDSGETKLIFETQTSCFIPLGFFLSLLSLAPGPLCVDIHRAPRDQQPTHSGLAEPAQALKL